MCAMSGFFQPLLIMFVGVFLSMTVANSSNITIIGRNKTTVLCKEKERQALLMFKQSLIDDYGRLSSWSIEDGNEEDCCQWEGVFCNNRTGHVTSLQLNGSYNKPLRGKINPSLFQLKHLHSLDLSYNDFGSSLFPEINGSLNKLWFLNVANSGLNPSIINQLGNLSRLEFLDLSENNYNITNFDWLYHLSSLKYLDLSFNNLGENNLLILNLPDQLENLQLISCGLQGILSRPVNSSFASPRVINLSGNRLTFSSTYKGLVNICQNLAELNLSGNLLQAPIPGFFSNMISLKSLDLSSNQLEVEILEFLGNMCNLTTLLLRYNNLTGLFPKFPRCLENSLEILRLSGNKLHGPLPDMRTFSSLTTLFLPNNQLNGSLSKGFSNLPSKIAVLSLAGNQLTGSLPDFCNASFSLEGLDISANRLNGTVTERLGCLSGIEQFHAAQNSLEGVISEIHFENLSKLQGLDLSFNHLTLNFSSDWVPPFQLNHLDLSYCKLGPYFPKWLQTQTSLNFLDISVAGISDTIPDWFWNISPSLSFLNLSQNQLTGIVSDFFSHNTTNFKGIDLSSNLFEGPLPLLPSNVMLLNLANNMFTGSLYPLCKSTGEDLISLDVSNNSLSGELSECLFDWKELRVLNLDDNNFSGEIPRSVGSLFSLQTLNLHNNDFFGDLPSSLKNCSRLMFLDLSNNRLSGNIPSWIAENLSSLAYLSLQANEFNGKIPVNLCWLAHLQILDLSENIISGTIPRCLNNLTAMSQEVSDDIYKTVFSFSFGHQIVNGNWITGGTSTYIGKAWVQWKGRRYYYEKYLGLFTIIDLASNKLTGEIPIEITILSQLVALNLSRNYLTGSIPQNISQWKQMMSLDLSRNQLSGRIPTSMADLHFLSYLDLSYNNMFGKIPSGTQIDTFDNSSFVGNQELCGPPLMKECPEDHDMPPNEPAAKHENGDEFRKWFYAGMGLGFAVGFWGVCGALLLKRSWRHTYFQSLDKLNHSLIYFTFRLLGARIKITEET